MTEKATIQKIDGDMITLGCTTGACGNCSAGSLCNIKERLIQAVNKDHLDLQVGDVATIYLPPGKTVFSAFMVMIFPLLMFVLAFQLGEKLLGLSGEAQKSLLGLAGLAAGFGISFLWGKIVGKKQYPEIIGIERTEV